MAEPPRPGEPPPPGKRAERLLDDDQLPASVGQLKTLRRWLIVAGVWSVAATAIAVFALIQADEADEAAGEQIDEPVREHRAAESAEHEHDHGLGDELRDEPPARRADRHQP